MYKIIFFGWVVFFVGCFNSPSGVILSKKMTESCIHMQKAWWVLPSGSMDWWKVHADVASLQEHDSPMTFEHIEAQYLVGGICERMLINADSAVYDRSILTFLFEGNVSTKITFDKNDVSLDIQP